MARWFEEVRQIKGDNYISSRVRLARNWSEYAFPEKLSVKEATEMIGRLQYGLSDIGKSENEVFHTVTLDKLSETDRMELRERRILNLNTAQAKRPVGLMISEAEDISLIFNGDDHIRIQMLAPGNGLENLYSRADRLDDTINSHFPYAFDEKYGYLTSYPTNVGTGMRANAVLHLPSLSQGTQFENLIEGMTRFGVTIKGVYGKGRENYGSLYDISNSKTLGISEKEIINIVSNVAAQLNRQENQTREKLLETEAGRIRDEVFKSYGVLRYARRLSLKDALIYLSKVMTGIADEIIEPVVPTGIYRLMLGIQPANLLKIAQRPLNKDEMESIRAEYVREKLPEIKEG